MSKYTWQDRTRIVWTDEDISVATEALSKDDRLKQVATLSLTSLPSDALEHFAKLAFALGGVIKTEYGLAIMVPKTDDEIREAAVYALKYNDKHSELRDVRAEESGVVPDESDES